MIFLRIFTQAGIFRIVRSLEMQYNKGEESMKEDFRHEEKEFASYVTGCDGSASHTGISTSCGSQARHGQAVKYQSC